MKKYKHRKTGYIAEYKIGADNGTYQMVSNVEGCCCCNNIPAWMIEDSADWQPYPEVLLVTEDGVEITDKDQEVWILFDNWKCAVCSVAWLAAMTVGKWKKFSTAAARDEYILLNKPVLSVKEVMEIIENEFYKPYAQSCGIKIKQLAKSKL
jgi:hypothetical protein